jgi:hypothetical protein
MPVTLESCCLGLLALVMAGCAMSTVIGNGNAASGGSGATTAGQATMGSSP